jgi:hypothetical protein
MICWLGILRQSQWCDSELETHSGTRWCGSLDSVSHGRRAYNRLNSTAQ